MPRVCNLTPQNSAQPVKMNWNKKFDPKQKTIQTFNTNAQWLRKIENENPLTWELEVTSQPVPPDLPMVGKLAGTV